METMSDKSNEEVAEFFNGVTDALGKHALHICAMYGSCRSTLSPVNLLSNIYQYN